MPLHVRRHRRLLAAALLLLAAPLGVACSSRAVPVATHLPDRYQELGAAEGRACGFHLFGLIGIVLSSRVERAHQRAIASVPGAVSLARVSMEEEWQYLLIGTNWCTTIKGTGVR